MSQWIRLWEDMPTDPKWRVIARRSGRPLAEVVSLFTQMMINAGRSSVPGTLEGWNDEDAGAALDMDEAHVTAIREAMQGKVLHGDTLTGWDKRQPKREDDSAERVRAFRERNNGGKPTVTRGNAPGGDETRGNAPGGDETLCNAPGGDETLCNAPGGDETLCNAPEERRGDTETEKEESSLRSDSANAPKKNGGAVKSTPRSELTQVVGAELAAEVVEHRQRMRKPLTTYAAACLAKQFLATGEPQEAAKMMIERGWQGFDAHWFENARGNAAHPARAGPNGSAAYPLKTSARLDVILESIEDERNGISYDTSVF